MPRSAEERQHPILPLDETLLLFEGQHLLAHLRFPELDQLVAGDDVLLFENFFCRQQSGLIHEDRALVFVNGFHDRAKRFGRSLYDFFEAGHAFEKMFVEREIFLLFVILDLVLFEGADTREHEQLVLTAKTELAIVVVIGTARLTEHDCVGAD